MTGDEIVSRFKCNRFLDLVPYTPGEQPVIKDLIKLNTNEMPFMPSEKAISMAGAAARELQLYPDPECSKLSETVADSVGVERDMVLMTNGSDEILNFAFMAFCDENTRAVFPDITYGFYKVFANVNRVPYTQIPLDDKLEISVEDYKNCKGTIFLANPNAPTGIYIGLDKIEEILRTNKENVVVVDEAYIDFGGESAVGLVKKYDNLLVTQTFSKSRAMAGARLGFGIACKELIADLNTIKYSTNPYNINKMTMAAGLGTLYDDEYTRKNCKTICENRSYTTKALREMGFEVLESLANFVFARHKSLDGGKLYKSLRERGILVRHFDDDKIADFNRITIGTKEQMDRLLLEAEKILKEGIKK